MACAVALLASVAAAQSGGITTGGGSQRPINVRGTVAMADGRPLPDRAALELVCPPHSQSQGRTDVHGTFSVELGMYRFEGASDAAMSSPGAGTNFGGQLAVGRTVNQVDGMSIVALIGCSLRARNARVPVGHI